MSWFDRQDWLGISNVFFALAVDAIIFEVTGRHPTILNYATVGCLFFAAAIVQAARKEANRTNEP